MKHGNRCGGLLPLLWAVGLAACGGTAREEAEAIARTEQAHEQGRFTGALRWARHITGEPVIIGEFPREKSGTAVKDGEEHVLVLYGFTGNIDLGERFVRAPGGPTSTAIALARYAQKTGRLEWLKVFGPGPGVDGDVFGGQIAVDSQRNIILQAAALGVDFGDGPVWEGEYLLKFDRHGRLLWRRSFEANPGFLGVFDLLTDSHDNIVMAGTLVGTVDFGSGPISSKPDPAEGFFGPSPFVAKFSPGGESLWAYARSEDFGEGLGATVDSQDHILLCGSLSPGGAGSTPFVLRLSPDGHPRWERRLSIPGGGGQARDVAAHGNRIVLTGTFTGTFTFRGRAVTSEGAPSEDAFLAAYTREGEERWARGFGFSGERIAMDQKDGVIVTGTYRDGDDLGRGPLPGKEPFSTNLFVAKYDRISGEPLWTQGFPAGLAEPSSLVATKDGRSVVLGSFRSGSLLVGKEEWPQQSPNDLFLIGLDR